MERKKQNIRTNHWLMITVLLLVLTGAGCATTSEPEPPVVPDFAQDLDPERGDMPRMKPLAEIAPEAAMEEKMPFESKLFSLNILDAELQEAIMPMTNVAGLNLVFDRDVDVRAPVSVNFSNLPLKKALDLVLSSHGYYYKIEGNTLRVKAMETRVFHLNYSLVSSTGSSDISGDNFSVESEAEEDDTKVWEIIEEVLGVESSGSSEGSGGSGKSQSLLSDAGQAQINKMAGVIVVTDRPENIKRVAQYLDELEKVLRRQVLIEARLVEVVLNDDHEYGIDWNLIREKVGDWGFNIGAGLASGAEISSDGLVLGGTSLAGDTLPNGSSTANAYYSHGKSTITGVLRALSTTGTVNVLSAPRVSVLNNQSASINMTTELPYEETEVTFEDGERTVAYTINRVSEGISLGIIPQIGPDGMTNLLIVPRVAQNQRFEDFEQSKNVPVLTVRETSTMVRVPDGGTVVLGGIIEEKR
ncbi:MAG: secretin and TonB N-terminal domain-containing protein, partial [Desulfonatronovibrio sp.]